MPYMIAVSLEMSDEPNYFLMPEMFKLSVVILGILQFRNFLSKWCQIFLMALLPIFSKS